MTGTDTDTGTRTASGGSDEDFVPLLPMEQIRAMRDQSIALRLEGRFEPSWSERVVANDVLMNKEHWVQGSRYGLSCGHKYVR